MAKIERFFASDAVKNIFDNIRNLGLSAVVLTTGSYLVNTLSPDAVWKETISYFGYTLIACGFLLLFICALHGYFLLKKTVLPLLASKLIVLIYFCLAILLFITMLRQKGIIIDIWLKN